MRQNASAVAGVDDHKEPAAAQIDEGVPVRQDLQAAAVAEFGVSAPQGDQVPDRVEQRVLVGALPGDGGASLVGSIGR